LHSTDTALYRVRGANRRAGAGGRLAVHLPPVQRHVKRFAVTTVEQTACEHELFGAEG
jgi:hypothetical protein